MRYELVEKEIPVSDLRIGMQVIRLDCPWEETNFLLQGFVIRSQDDIDALQSQCQRVVIEGKLKRKPAFEPKPVRRTEKPTFMRFLASNDTTREAQKKRRAKNSLPEAGRYAGKARITYINKVDVNREIRSAQSSYDNAREMAHTIMAGVRIGRAVDMNRAREVVDHCVDSILRNDDALLLLTKLKHKDEYTAEHSLNVSVLAAAFGKHLGMLEEEIRTLGLCGLLHDVGKVKIRDDILSKPGRLSPEEFSIMQEHVNYGRDILMSIPKVVHATIDVAYNHHERMDGNGYPRGLKGEQIPYFAKIVGIVDAYDAITSTRTYDSGRSSMEALEIIYRYRGTQFDTELANEFIRMIGIYPPGSIVEMSNGEVGIVMASNPKNKRKPKIILVRDARKERLRKYRMIDLIKATSDARGEPCVIAKEIPDGSHGVHLQRFLEMGLVLGYQTIDETSA